MGLNKGRKIRPGDRITLVNLKRPAYGLINKFIVNFEPIEFLDFLLSRKEIRKVNQRRRN